MVTVSEQRCNRCGLVKTEAEFHRNRRRTTGLDSKCKDCARKRVRGNVPGLEEPTHLPSEVWKPAPGFADTYSVSSLGRVRRDAPGKRTRVGAILKGSPDQNGYLRVRLASRPDRRQFPIHQLVATAFIGPCPDRHEVNHIDGDRQNNAAANLEYVTHAENIGHSFEIGNRSNKGRHNPRAKLSPDDVREIRRLAESTTQRELARRFGVAATTISQIVRRVRWKHLE